MLHRFWCQLARRSQSPIPLHVLGIQAFAVVQLFHVLGGKGGTGEGGVCVCVCVSVCVPKPRHCMAGKS